MPRPPRAAVAERRALTALLFVQVFFGLLPVAGKLAFEALHPFGLAAIRTAGAALVLLAFYRWTGAGRVDLRKDGPRIALYALFGIVLNQGLFVMGLARTTAVHATLLVATIPVQTYIIAVLARREDIGPRRALGILTAFAGVAFLVAQGFGVERRMLLGDALVFLNATSYALFLVFSKRDTERLGALPMTTWVLVFGAVVFVPLGLANGLATAPIDGRLGLVLVFIVLGPTVGAYTLTATALRTVSSSTVAAFIFLQPLVAASTAAWILGEDVSPRVIPAAALVLSGVYLVARRRPRALRGALPKA